MKAIVKLGMDKEEIKAFKKVYRILSTILDNNELLPKVIESMWDYEGITLNFETFVEGMDILSSITTDPYGYEYSEEDLDFEE